MSRKGYGQVRKDERGKRVAFFGIRNSNLLLKILNSKNMSEQSIEQFLAMAKKRQVTEANKPIEEAAQRTQRIIGEIEKGAPEHARLMSEDETATEKVKQADKEIMSVESQLQSVVADRDLVNNDAQFEALRKDPELFQKALEHIQEREDTLKTELEQKKEGKIEVKGTQASVRGQGNKVAAEAKQFLGEKEVPSKKLDAVWEYVQYERDIEGEVSRFNGPRVRGASPADEYIYGITDRGNTTGEFTITLDGMEEDSFYKVLFSKPYEYPHFDEAALQPKLFNEFASGVVDKINKALKDEKFLGSGYGPEKPLTNEQLEVIKNGKVSVLYKGKTIPVWDAGKPAPLLEEKTPEVFNQLTPNEQRIAQGAVKDSDKTKDSLLQELKMSEYSPEADAHFRGQAGAENAEYNQRKLTEKLPEYEASIKNLGEKESSKQTELASLEELHKHVENYPNLENQVINLKNNNENTASYIRSYESKRDDAERRRKALPQKVKILGGGPKDKDADNRLLGEIRDLENKIKLAQEQQTKTETELKPLEQQVETEKQAIQQFEAGAFDGQGKLTLQNFEVKDRVLRAKYELEKIKQEKEKTDKVKGLWEQGKFLNLSVEEAWLVAPETSGAELDQMANGIASQMENYFNQYTNWNRFPDTNWTVKDGKLKQDTAHWGNNVSGGDWNSLANLHSEQLNVLLAQKVGVALSKKFDNKIGNIKITVE